MPPVGTFVIAMNLQYNDVDVVLRQLRMKSQKKQVQRVEGPAGGDTTLHRIQLFYPLSPFQCIFICMKIEERKKSHKIFFYM